MVISERTVRAQEVEHTHSCRLPHSLLFVPNVHSSSEPTSTLGSRAVLAVLDSTAGCHLDVRCPASGTVTAPFWFML